MWLSSNVTLQKQSGTQVVPVQTIFLKVASNSFDLSGTERASGAASWLSYSLVSSPSLSPTPPIHPTPLFSVSVSAGCLAGWVGDMLCTLRPVSNLLSLALSLTDHLHSLTAPKIRDTECLPLHHRPLCQHSSPSLTHTHTNATLISPLSLPWRTEHVQRLCVSSAFRLCHISPFLPLTLRTSSEVQLFHPSAHTCRESCQFPPVPVFEG